jgi:hypothetical protein
MTWNVWDMETAQTHDCVNEIEARKLPFGTVAPLSQPFFELPLPCGYVKRAKRAMRLHGPNTNHYHGT